MENLSIGTLLLAYPINLFFGFVLFVLLIPILQNAPVAFAEKSIVCRELFGGYLAGDRLEFGDFVMAALLGISMLLILIFFLLELAVYKIIRIFIKK